MTGFLAYRPKAFLFEITTWIDCSLAPWLDLQEFDLGSRLSWFFLFYVLFCNMIILLLDFSMFVCFDKHVYLVPEFMVPKLLTSNGNNPKAEEFFTGPFG